MYILSIFMLLSSFAITASSTTTSLLSLSERERVAVADKACCIVDDILAGFEECCSMLAEQNEVLQYEISLVSDQVETLSECTLGTQITQAMIPYTISTPGHYYLCDSVSSTGANAITLNANDVYLNLNGFTVSSTDMRAIVTAGGSYSNVTIENGSLSTVAQRAMEVGNITNFTVRNVALSTIFTSVSFLANITDLVMEDCYVTANGAGGGAHGLEALGINGGRIENVYVYNTSSGSGIRVSTASSSATLECINCMVDVAGFGFDLQPGAGIVLRDCVASGCVRGYQVMGGHLLENCVAHNNAGNGFAIEIATKATLRNCVATATTSEGIGFWVHASSEILFEGCISENNNGTGFMLAFNDGGNANCAFDHCAAYNNGGAGFYVAVSNVNTLLAYSTAFGNDASGIYNDPGATNTYVINCRSQHDSTCCNPAYNLNGSPDILNGATEIVES